LILAEHDPDEDVSGLTVRVPERARDELAQAVGQPGRPTASPNHAPPVCVQHHVDTVPTQPGAFVEAVRRPAWKLDGRDKRQQRSLRRCTPRREREQDGLVKRQITETTDACSDSQCELRPSRRRGHLGERALGCTDARE
jgi:hypothetical protein